MEVREGLKYTESHEWIRKEGSEAVIGITDYAQGALGDIVFVEVPEIGLKVSKGDETANIESVKVAEAVYAPVSGTVVEVNEDLESQPEIINEDPFGVFIYAIEMTNPSELDDYMSPEDYEAFAAAQES